MRKSFHMALGIAIGVALTLSASVAADGLKSIVGEQIDGEFAVTLNGKELAAKAGTIKGTSYIPVRAVSEALNLEVGFDEQTGINLSDKKEGVGLQTTRKNEVGTLSDKTFEGMRTAEWNGQIYFSFYDFGVLYRAKYAGTEKAPWVIKSDEITFFDTDGVQTHTAKLSDPEALIVINGDSYINTKFFPTKFPQ